MENIAFVVSTLGESAPGDESVMRMLMFARARLEHAPRGRYKASIVSLTDQTDGWDRLSGIFATGTRKKIQIQVLPPAPVPTVSIGNQKLAYYFHEHVKAAKYTEVHCADSGGIAYYAALARRLGIESVKAEIDVHVLGSTLFGMETMDALVNDPKVLMDDFLEIGSVQAADRIYVHDRHAWNWYEDKIVRASSGGIIDISRKGVPKYSTKPASNKVLYYGKLGPDEGLPLFCDAIDRLAASGKFPEEIHFVGPAGRVGGVDAVTYIHLRAAQWKCRVVKKRNLSIDEELDYLRAQGGLVICNTVRRQSLRAHLVGNSDLPYLFVSAPQRSPSQHNRLRIKGIPANPGTIAAKINEAMSEMPRKRRRSKRCPVFSLWKTQFRLGGTPAKSPPLKISTTRGPLVSVCIAHYSRPNMLRLALESLRAQSYRNFEVIVVDDGSSDLSVRIELDRIAREMRPLGWRLVRQPNRYLGAARNAAAAKARGEYLLFMDDDNVATPDEIATLVAVAKRTGAEIVTTAYHGFSNPADIAAAKPSVRFTPFGGDLSLGVFTPCFGDANSLVQAKFFRKVGGFSEDYGITHEDWEFFARSSLEGAKIVVYPEPLFWYRVDENSMYRSKRMQLHVSANLRRHIRPYSEKLPHYQSKLVQLTQGLMADLPVTIDAKPQPAIEIAKPIARRSGETPFARVAVIIRTKNRPIMLRRALQKILDQSFQDWLAVIVNDGGDPEVVELVVDPMRTKLADRLLILHHPVSLGMQSAANAGIVSCNSDLVTIHDDDDSWDPEFLNRTVSHLESRGWNSNVGGVVTRSNIIVEEICDEEICERDRFVFNETLNSISLINLTIENRFPPISFVFRRTAMEQIGYFEEKYGVLGDWDFHMRMLQMFEIDVIPEPLANYHHRSTDTTGAYGNSVHAQSDIHIAKRTELINDYVRKGSANGGIGLSHLVISGDLHKATNDYLWQLDQRLRYVADKVYEGIDNHQPSQEITAPKPHPLPSRNLIENGDFRVWPGVGKIIQLSHKGICIPCPGFILSFDGKQATFEVRQRRWRGPGVNNLARGKTYLEIRNSAWTGNGDWLYLECLIPSAKTVAGKTICISGMSKLQAERQSLFASAQYDLSRKKKKWVWDTKRVALSNSFERWSVTFDCPALGNADAEPSDICRFTIKLPYKEDFTFWLTNVQAEIGEEPTAFVYQNTSDLNDLPAKLPVRIMNSFRQIWN